MFRSTLNIENKGHTEDEMMEKLDEIVDRRIKIKYVLEGENDAKKAKTIDFVENDE